LFLFSKRSIVGEGLANPIASKNVKLAFKFLFVFSKRHLEWEGEVNPR